MNTRKLQNIIWLILALIKDTLAFYPFKNQLKVTSATKLFFVIKQRLMSN